MDVEYANLEFDSKKILPTTFQPLKIDADIVTIYVTDGTHSDP